MEVTTRHIYGFEKTIAMRVVGSWK